MTEYEKITIKTTIGLLNDAYNFMSNNDTKTLDKVLTLVDEERRFEAQINKAISKMEEASKKDKLCGGYPYQRCIDILKEVLNDG